MTYKSKYFYLPHINILKYLNIHFIYRSVQPVIHKIEIIKQIKDFLLISPGKNSLMFTDICPIHVTNRKYAVLVLIELLG